MIKNLTSLLSSLLVIFYLAIPVNAARDTNSFDGNIFPIYAGNGSLVPPQSTIAESLKNHRTSVIVFYLDDSADSKQFAPVVSGLKLLWTSSIDLLPLTTDELDQKASKDPTNPSFYWHGNIPQIVVLDGEGNIQLDKEGQVSIEEINQAITKSTGLNTPDFTITIKSFNEYNSDASKDGYTDPRK
ncbi:MULTISPECIES: thylakoid membrane photosystem I accumulation factor [Prochlorococcus]|uniref:thylakoid membrane photosystem I accumulation factor n=1 Tax=Prochlorococcus TaxID=1218 RepID=UPI0005339E02|nr:MULTISPECIES: thylakoid membrane photosystem I accumulation factor [Prochlorococcus]KGG12379.1 Thioredoxin family protein [Prochlorococcus sp. MIT 0601]